MPAGRDFALNVIGETLRNADGSSRQVELGRCKRGEPVELRRDASDKRHPEAVAVFSARGVQIGYVPHAQSAPLAERLKKGLPVGAIAERVNGGGGKKLGLTIRINDQGARPGLPEAVAQARAGCLGMISLLPVASAAIAFLHHIA